MKNRPTHIDLPLEELFRRLEAAGFATDMARRLRLLRLLHREGLAQASRWDELKYRLAPFVVRNAQEQERFYTLLDEMQAAWEAEWAAETERVSEPELPAAAQAAGTRHLGTWAAGVALALLLGLGVWWAWPRPEPGYVNINILREPVAGDTLVLVGVGVPAAQMNWTIKDHNTGDTLLSASGTDTLRWPIAKSEEGRQIEVRIRAGERSNTYIHWVKCASPPPAPLLIRPEEPLRAGRAYTLRAEAEEGLELRWVMPAGDTLRGPQVSYTFAGEGVYTLRLYAACQGQETYCYTRLETIFTIGADTPELATVPLRADTPTTARLGLWYWLLPLLALLLALLLWRRWLERRRPAAPAEARPEDYPLHDAAPYYIPYLPQEDKISVSRDFFRIADVLRRREEAPRRRFDAGASVRATVEAGGYPSWRERADSQPVRWLLLVEQPDERSQCSRLLLRLAYFLVKLEAPAEVWTHDGRFGHFYGPDAPEGITATELYRRYPGHRLVLLGEALGLANAYGPSLLPQPLAALKRWPRRLLLTPAAPADWGLHEALLHQHFWLHPADTAGAWAGFDEADRLEEHEPRPFEAWRQACCRLHTDAPARLRAWDTPQDHRAYLPDELHYRWLCALAVCPQPDWAITAALGRAVGAPVSHDSLLRLARIPWLDANALPTELRLALLRELSPEDATTARLALLAELERLRERVAGSFAETEWTTNLAVQHFALDPHDEAHKQSLRELLALGLLSGEQLAELDYLVAERIDRRGLPDAAFADLAAWLARPAPPRPRPRELAAALVTTALALLLLAYGALAARLQPDAPWMRQAPVYDLAAELNNQAVGRWEAADSLADAGARVAALPGEADSLLALALQQRAPAYYALADSNRSALRYNAGVLGLRRYYGPARDTAALAEACDWLARVPERPRPELYLAARHGLGLCGYYRADSAAALAVYHELLARTQGQYFDSISPQQPVNLRSLLLAEGWLAPPTLFRLSGELRDSATNAPLSGASVRSGSYAATTDAAGRYTLSLPANPTGRYRLQYEATGYTRRSATLAADSGGRLPLLRLARGPEGELRGTVLDSLSGQPLPEVLVSGPDGQTARTDAAGRYALPPPPRPAAAYELRFSREGYASLTRRLPAREEAKVLMRREETAPRPAMVRIKGGAFNMGCTEEQENCDSDEKPVTRVSLNDFQLGQYEVTVGEFARFITATGYRTDAEEGDGSHIYKDGEFSQQPGVNWRHDETGVLRSSSAYDHPVIHISWNDAIAYCNWLSEQHGYTPAYQIDGDGQVTCNWSAKGYRLPTEAEWEYAARSGGKAYLYAWGNGAPNGNVADESAKRVLSDLAVFEGYDDGYVYTAPVGRFRQGDLGLYDMSGNVWEWCWDWKGDYPGGRVSNPRGAVGGVDRVLRGGGWGNRPQYCRVAYRDSDGPALRDNNIGFRLARS